MKSKMLFFNIHIVLEDLKRYWGMAVLYFLTLFFSGPLNIMSLFNNPNESPNSAIKNFLNLRHADLQMVLSIGFPILLAVLIFRYLHQNKSTTVMHSFPITRGQLFHSHNIAGVVLLLLPVVLTAVILIVLLNIHHDGSKLFEEIFTISSILKWVWFSTLTNLIVYVISVLAAMITGISLIQMILSFISIFLPIGISFLMIHNFDQLLYGFVINDRLLERSVAKIIPITSFMCNETIDSNFVLWYIFLSIALYFIAYLVYKKRHLESASDTIAFELLKPIFKYGFTFCSMILGGAYFYMIERIDSWLYIGYFMGAILGYLIAEMIIQKSIWIFKNLKGFAIYGIVILIVFTGIKFDLVGYEKRIPNIADIQSVYYGNGLYRYWSDEEDRDNHLKTAENIHLVRALHSEVIAHKDEFIQKRENRSTERIGIAYNLKNGKTLTREYDVPTEFVNTNDAISKIYESTEYKMNYYDIFHLNLNKVNYIDIDPKLKDISEPVKIVVSDEMGEMINAIKADILDETYKEFMNNKSHWADIHIIYHDKEKSLESEYRNNDIYIAWKKHDKHLSSWLKQNGYYEKSRIMPKDIDYIIIEKTSKEIKNSDSYDPMELKKELKENKNEKRLEIKDKEQMEEILVNYGVDWRDEKSYMIGIYYTNGVNDLVWMTQENAPEFVKNFFE
ncbi:DUF6449 domain-containing protein [Marinisporobacter balticus]|uniref:ABC-2 type transport system permease protein n=1 Tax=Marinisporobacter balticus TaxID=2018667 RepID=A0A4R2KVL0_9FIRM|nr:DUF6449 domain-containing protein [Marinisporobacter balticus]TCO75239.1 ABC-2 type transport system permease protein [Marinisporobacter balticus]